VIVVDASYTLALVMPDEERPRSMAEVVTGRLGTSTIWPLEVANALRSSLRRGRVLAADVDLLCQRVAELQVDVVAPPHVLPRRHLDSALQHELTPYDATYLDLAMLWRCPLATRDAGLQAAAGRAGLTVLS
jgi:predicted nucleic acid-binding protein